MRVDLYLSLHENVLLDEAPQYTFGASWSHFIKSVDWPTIPDDDQEITFMTVLKNNDIVAIVEKKQMDINGFTRIFLVGLGITANIFREYLKKDGWQEVEFWTFGNYDTPEAIRNALIKR